MLNIAHLIRNWYKWKDKQISSGKLSKYIKNNKNMKLQCISLVKEAIYHNIEHILIFLKKFLTLQPKIVLATSATNMVSCVAHVNLSSENL